MGEKYFIVCAKVGHVGRSLYVPMNFAIIAKSAKHAAIIARKMPGVKKRHQNAIISVSEVNKEDYYKEKKKSYEDDYWKKTNMSTRANQALFYSRLEAETNRYYIKKTNKIDTRNFRYYRACQYDKLMRKDIAIEYGILV